MKNAKRNLKVYSGLFIILTVVDVMIMVGNFLAKNISIDNFAKNFNINENVMWPAFIATIGVIVLTFIIAPLFIGIKGLKQADGKYKGGANITLAIIMLVVNILILAYCLYALLKEDHKNQYFYMFIIYICFYIEYIRCAKILKSNKNK